MILNEDDVQYIKNKFTRELVDPVTILFFSSKQCELCNQDKELMNELVSIDDRLKLTEINIEEKKNEAKALGIDSAPAFMFTGKITYPLYYIGSPIGHEFAAFLEDIVNVSTGKTNLSEAIKKDLKSIDKPVEIKVFVTPSCPYCPSAVHTAHMFTIENQKIVSKMIEAEEFPELAEKYEVMAVPKVVINEKVQFEGAYPPVNFLKFIHQALD